MSQTPVPWDHNTLGERQQDLIKNPIPYQIFMVSMVELPWLLSSSWANKFDVDIMPDLNS